jgi:hypothetical protein
MSGYVTAFPRDLTSILGHSVVANLPRNYFLHIVRQTDTWIVEGPYFERLLATDMTESEHNPLCEEIA